MKLNKAMERHIIYCRETRRMSPNTVKSYEYAVRRFVEFMGFRYTVDEVEQVCKNHILDYLQDLSSSYSPSSATQHFTIVHVFFNYLEDYGAIEDSPFRRIHERKLKIPKRLPTTLTIEEIRDILTAAYVAKPRSFYGAVRGEDMLHYRDCLILEVLFNTGMRVHELRGLKLSDYDEKSGFATVEQRNNMKIGQEIEIFQPNLAGGRMILSEMYNEEGEAIDVAPHPQQIVKMKMTQPVEPYAILRRDV